MTRLSKVGFIVAFVFLSLQWSTITNAQTSLLEKRCGVEQSSIPLGGISWGRKAGKDVPIPQDARTTIDAEVLVEEAGSASTNFQISSDGTSLAYFAIAPNVYAYFSGYFQAVQILLSDGSVLKLPAESGWWELGPELSADHFGILAYDSNYVATLLDLSYSGGKLSVNNLENLGFTINIAGSLWQKRVYISQDWKYLAYTSAPTEPAFVSSFNLYSRSQHQLLWQLPLRGEIPTVYWDTENTEAKIVAWVNLGGGSGNGILLGVDETGQIQTHHDLSKILGEDIRIAGGTSQVSPDGYLALWLQTLVADKLQEKGLFLLDVDSGKLIDLCISDKTIIGPYLWAEDGKYLLVQRFDGMNAVPLEMMIIDVATGDYSLQYLADDGQALYLVAWSKPQEQSQQK